MPVYSEVLKDDEILNILKNKYKRVLLIGCGSCMNESLAYLYELPLSVKSNEKGHLPIPIIKELERIAKMIKDNGYEVDYEYIPEESNSRCMIDCERQIYHISLKSRPEIVLILSCPAGRELSE